MNNTDKFLLEWSISRLENALMFSVIKFKDFDSIIQDRNLDFESVACVINRKVLNGHITHQEVPDEERLLRRLDKLTTDALATLDNFAQWRENDKLRKETRSFLDFEYNCLMVHIEKSFPGESKMIDDFLKHNPDLYRMAWDINTRHIKNHLQGLKEKDHAIK